MSETDNEWYTLASIVRPQGRRGEVLADLLTDFPEQFTGAAGLVLLHADERRTPAKVESYWMPTGRNAGRIVLKLESVDSITEAEGLAGCRVQVHKADRVRLDEHTYYVTDLIGCTLTEGDRTIGEIVDMHFPSNTDGRRLEDAPALFVVRRADGDELMVPFVNDFVEEIDTAAKSVRMKLPAGLLELNG